MAMKFTSSIRIDCELMEKLKIIAEREKRSLNMQIEYSLEYYIKEYEKIHGEISRF